MAKTRIKICGIVSESDALECLKAGADYLGFNFWRGSPRHIEPQQAKEILERLRQSGVTRLDAVGVFVDAPAEEIRRTLAACGANIVQLHGSESPQDVAALQGLFRIKAIQIEDPSCAKAMDRYGAEAYLADSPSSGGRGGTGQAYDYSLTIEAARRHRLFLAGGLTAETVGQAIEMVRPYGVDVASGVEISPGVKDIEKVRAFCKAVREAAA